MFIETSAHVVEKSAHLSKELPFYLIEVILERISDAPIKPFPAKTLSIWETLMFEKSTHSAIRVFYHAERVHDFKKRLVLILLRGWGHPVTLGVLIQLLLVIVVYVIAIADVEIVLANFVSHIF